jgi:hypothetical protein
MSLAITGLIFAILLILTGGVKVAVAAILGVRKGSDFALILACNLITTSLVLVLVPRIVMLDSLIIFWVLPLLAQILIEWVLYRSLLDYYRLGPLVFSIIINVAAVVVVFLVFICVDLLWPRPDPATWRVDRLIE